MGPEHHTACLQGEGQELSTYGKRAGNAGSEAFEERTRSFFGVDLLCHVHNASVLGRVNVRGT
jgi:hypothetical protein